MSFFDQMMTAIYKFQSYPKLVMQKFSKVMCFLLIFTFVIAIVNAIPYALAYREMGGITGAIEKYVPDFSIEKGKFNCETVDFTDEMMSVKIFIDNNEDADNIDTSGYSFSLVADSDKMILSDSLQKRVIDFSQFENQTVNKNSVVNIFSSTRVRLAIFTILGVITIFSLSFNTFIGLLMISVLASLINLCLVKANISYAETLKLSVYARTFPSILITAITFLGFAGGGFIYWGLLVTYIYLGLKNIKKQEAIILARL